MSAILEDLELDAGEPTPDPVPDRDAGWRTHANGRQFAPARGRGGMVFREGNETLEEAHARDQRDRGKDKKPRAKTKAPKLPPAPTETTLATLEFELAQALAAPADIVAAMGDQWAADHFTRQGPRLARHLCVAAKYNPWLRAKLEAAMFSGDDMLIRLIMTMGLAGAMVSYALPPVIYYLDPPFLAGARDMYRVPVRPKQPQPQPERPADASAPRAATAEAPEAAAAAVHT